MTEGAGSIKVGFGSVALNVVECNAALFFASYEYYFVVAAFVLFSKNAIIAGNVEATTLR